MPAILAETITDTSSNIITVQSGDKTANIQPATITEQSCAQTYFKTPTFKGLFALMILFFIIEMILKGFAMWRAAHRDSKPWFIALLILSTAGILPAIYLIITRKKKKSKK